MKEHLQSIKIFAFLILSSLNLFLSYNSFGEGTKDIWTIAAQPYYLHINRSGGLTVPFAMYTPNTFAYQTGTSAKDYRLNIHTCNIGEKVRFGFKAQQSNTYYRIKRQSDNAIVFGPMLMPTVSIGKAGYINSYTEAVTGPKTIVGAGGYNDTGFVATEVGDYYVEINLGNGTIYNATGYDAYITYFDISVVDLTNTIRTGRLWSKAWQMIDANNAFNGNFYIFSDDSIVTRISPNGLSPHAFSISCNATGCTNTGSPAVDRKGRAGAWLYPQYKIFFNNPDIACYGTGAFGSIVGTPTVVGCGGVRCINLTVDKPGNIIITLDLNGSPGYQVGTSDRQISATVVKGLNCVPWDGLDGLGNPVAPGFSFTMKVDFLNGITHLPLYDGEDNPNGYKVSLVRPAGPVPKVYWDDSNFIPSNYVAATAIDGISNYGGCATATGCHRWKSRGSNACPPCSETSNSWWYAKIDSVKVTYINNTVVTDANTLTPGTGFANNNFSSCGTPTPISLKGSVVGPAITTGLWTAPGGDGVFSSNTNMTGTYTPGANDITNGFVKIKLTSVASGASTCPPFSDSMLITLVKPPVVFAGVTKSVCKNNPTVNLSDATKNAFTTSVAWSGGAGIYVSSANVLNPTYTPSAAELLGASKVLTLTGTGDPLCANATSTVTINFTPAPTVSAGGNASVCSSNPNVSNITGVVSAAGNLAWKSSSGCVVCFSAPGSLVTNYNPSLTDISNGSVTLTLSDSMPGCAIVKNTMLITIVASPTANAGINQSKCKNKALVTLSGTVTNATSQAWTSSSGCVACFSSTTSLTPVYTPSATDLSNNSVILTLTASKAGCTDAISTMTVSFTASPTVDAGPIKIDFCADKPSVQLAGIVTGSSGAQWSGGAGSYVTNNTDLNAVYTLNPIEVTVGSVKLFLTTTGNGTCNAVKDSITLSKNPIPTPNAGPTKSVCYNNPTVTLTAASILGAYGAISWTSSTSGAAGFVDPTLLNPTYGLNATDLANGSVTLTMSVTNATGPACAPQTSSVIITVTSAPIVSAGADRSVCLNNPVITLNGASSTGSGTWSILSGSGTITNPILLNSTFTAASVGSTILILTSNANASCNPVKDTMVITTTPSPTSNPVTPASVCANKPMISITGTTSTGTGTWSAAGSFGSANSNLTNTYTPTAGQITAGSATIKLTTTNNGTCNPVSTNIIVPITSMPTANAGVDQVICASSPVVNLSGTFTVATGVTWSGGAGTFSNNNIANPTYTLTAGELLTGSVTLTMITTGNGNCNSVSDQILITVNKNPTVDAGSDQVLCGSTVSATLNGTETIATGGTWTTSGTGTFASASSLNTTYTPSPADKTSGLVTLTLTTTGNGVCSAATDQMNISFTVVPTVNAGPDQTVCSNDFPVQLAGTGSPSTWLGGSGSFSLSRADMNATYIPTALEVTAGSITLTLKTNASGACPQITDNVKITLLQGPAIAPLSNISICGNQNSVPITATVTNALGGFWSTSGTGSFGNPASLNTTYNPSPADKLSGAVTISLITTGNGTCSPASATFTLTILPAVTANAGPDQTLCKDGINIPLNGSVTGATGGTWTKVTGGGTVNNASNLATASYTPIAVDNSVTLRLTTTGSPAGCPAQTDDVIFTLTPAPTANADVDQTVCGDVASVTLNGAVTVASGGSWTTTGAGTFTPDNVTLNAKYVPAVNETGTFIFTLTTTGNGTCAGVYSDQMTVTITPKPTVNAGINRTVCANKDTVALAGVVTVATGGTWTSSGDGVFQNITGGGLNADYIPGNIDKTNGSVNLTLKTTGMGTCNAVTDVMVVNITPSPKVNAGLDRIVCANNSKVALLGTVTVATGGVWTTLGTGSFTGVSANGLSATYNSSPVDTVAHIINLVLTSSGNGACNNVTDTVQVTITPKPTVIAGPNQVICADSFYIKLNAMHTIATAGIWSTTGTGNFFNSNATFDTATYVPSPADRLGGLVTLKYTTTVQGACSPVSDQLTLTITPAPIVNAGADQTICETTSSISILGTNNGVSSGTIWTRSGDGVFGSPGTLGSSYSPGTADKAAGTVIITLTTTVNGTCKPASDQLILKILNKPVVDAGPDLTVCADIMAVGKVLTPTITNYSSLQWTTSGTGVFGPNASTLGAKYFPSQADTAAHSVILTLTANGNNPCASQSDNLLFTITPIPIVNAGSDQNVCNGSNIILNGKVKNAVGGNWSSSGTGTFAPSINTLNATYIPSPADTVSGSVTLTLTSTGMGTCNVVTDNMVITFRQKPSAFAGLNRIVCADASSIMLNGTVTNATGGIWSSSGTGGFSPNNISLNTLYFFTPADSTIGSVVLTLTTTGMGTCAAATSNMNITITPKPTADAGPPSLSACQSSGSIALHGAVTNAGGGFWATQGDGSFDDPTLLNPIYTFGLNDKLTNTVLLTFISQNNGACQFYTDSIRINLLLTTTVSAGPNRIICRADFPIYLQGSGASGIWSGGTLAGYSNVNSLTSTYMPTVGEAAGPSLTLTLTPTGSCGGVPSNVTFTFMNSPTVKITPQGDTCTNALTVNLKGAASASGQWTTTGSGSFGNNTLINTAYNVSNGDRTAGVIKFIYTIPASGFCNAVLDSIRFKIAPTPTVNSGPDQSRCVNALTTVNMNGAFSISSGIQWTKITNPGMGIITSPTSVNASYTMDPSDATFPAILFKLVTVGNGNCPAQSDTMSVTMSASPTVVIGPDSTVCADKKVKLDAAITVATGGAWSTSGSGTFSPSAVVLNPSYKPSTSDTSSHTPVILTFITTGNGICNAVSKARTITLTPKPLVSAGADNTICSGQDSTALSPTSKANAPTILWTTTGTGTFTPNSTALNAYYKPSALDKANGGAILRLASTGVVECDSVFDYKTLIIIPSPVANVNAGFDQTICRDQMQAQLAGFILIATGAKWDCQGVPCSGQFSPNDQNLNAMYIPSLSDTTAGIVILRLTTTTGNGICAPVYDEMKLKIIDIPHVKAGNPQTVCADTAGITLNGSIFHATLVPPGYSWAASGTGVFAPNAFVSNPTYTPSPQDIIAGAVGFTLTSTNNGTCQPYSNAITATITAKPTINAGIDKSTCANVANVNLAGTITVATKGIWKSAGTGTFSSTSANGLITKYAPSLRDDSAGVIFIKITTDPTTTGNCKSVTDQMMLTINPSPIVNAGINKTICSDVIGVSLTGSVLNATGGIWKSLGTGVFNPGASTLNGTYVPSSSDTAAHSVQLILLSTGNGLCNSEDDTVALTITPMPIVNSGTASICFPSAGSVLNGNVVHASGGQWSTSGSGIFSVNPFTLNATYYPSAADVSAGNVTLTLSSTGNGTCNAVSNSTNLNLAPVPLANAGGDQLICKNSSTIVAAVTSPNIAKYEWKRYSGLVISNSPNLNVTATIDTAFILTVYDNRNCSSLSDTVNVKVFDMPTGITLTGTSCATDSNVVTAALVPAFPPVPGTFQWFDNGVYMSGQNVPVIYPNSTGNYSVKYSYGACNVSSASFAMNPSPVIAGIDKINCVNNTTVLAVSNPIGGNTFTYTWAPNPTIIGPINNQQVSVKYGVVFDTLSYSVAVRNNFACTTKDSVYLITVAKPLLTLTNDTACQNDVKILVANPSNFGGINPPVSNYNPTYVWTKNGVNLNNNNDTLYVMSSGKYQVQMIIGDCSNNIDSSNMLFSNLPVGTLPANSRFCDDLDSLTTLNAGAVQEPGKIYTYVWQYVDPSGNVSNVGTTSQIRAGKEGKYLVTITSKLGSILCSSKDSVNLSNICAPRVFPPNVFTPEKDGKNAKFVIFGAHYKNMKVTVFNRWGEVIYVGKKDNAKDTYNLIEWDGTYKGEPMPTGVYPFIISYDGETDEYKGPYQIEGEVTILR